jgi:hypothetical protein
MANLAIPQILASTAHFMLHLAERKSFCDLFKTILEDRIFLFGFIVEILHLHGPYLSHGRKLKKSVSKDCLKLSFETSFTLKVFCI